MSTRARLRGKRKHAFLHDRSIPTESRQKFARDERAVWYDFQSTGFHVIESLHQDFAGNDTVAERFRHVDVVEVQ